MPAATHTLTEARHELLKRLPFLGFSFTTDTISTSGFVSVSQFSSSRFGAGHYDDMFMFRYTQSGNDRIKIAGNISGNTLQHSSSTNYGTSSGEVVDLLGIHPDDLNNCFVEAHRELTQKTLRPLSGGFPSVGGTGVHDFDMEFADATYWGTSVAAGSSSVSNTVATKETTDVLVGTQSLKLAASGTSGYSRGEKLRVNPGNQIWAAPVVRVSVGTLAFQWYDATNAALIGTTQTYTARTWALLRGQAVLQIPSNCYEIQPQFGQVGASDVAYVDMLFGPYENGQQMFFLPQWMDETYKVKSLRASNYRQAITGISGAYAATSRAWEGDQLQPDDFEVETLRRDVNSQVLQLRQVDHARGFDLNRPLWINAERQLSDVEPITTESSPSSAPFDEWVVLAGVKALTLVTTSNPDPQYKELLAKWSQRANVEELARPSMPVKAPHFVGRSTM